MAFSSRPNSQIERLKVAILTLTLSILIVIPANQVRAASTYDAGFTAVSGQIWARSGAACGTGARVGPRPTPVARQASPAS